MSTDRGYGSFSVTKTYKKPKKRVSSTPKAVNTRYNIKGPGSMYGSASTYTTDKGKGMRARSTFKAKKKRKIVDGPSGKMYGGPAARWHYEEEPKKKKSGSSVYRENAPEIRRRVGESDLKKKKGHENAANRMADRRNSIANRIYRHQYKGKYYGHDEFKGNLDALYAWKRAGKPNIKKYLSENPLKRKGKKY